MVFDYVDNGPLKCMYVPFRIDRDIRIPDSVHRGKCHVYRRVSGRLVFARTDRVSGDSHKLGLPN